VSTTPSPTPRVSSSDSAVFHEPALRLLADTLGADRIVVGSDYPYPLGESPAGGVVRGAAFLSEKDRKTILIQNGRRFLGLPT
jgi:aminocarboxymuconate-semialdehyde decarboxylase